MYTLKIESVDNGFLKASQALIQENKLWTYDIDTGPYSTTLKLSTMSIRELKRLVDMLESEEFMDYEEID